VVHNDRLALIVHHLAVLEPAFEFWCIGLTFLEHQLSWVLFAPLGSGFDKLVVVVVNKIVDSFVASLFSFLLEEHFLPRGIVRNLNNLFALTKRERGTGYVDVLAVAGVLGQDQGADLNYLIGFKHGLPLEADLVFDVRAAANPHWVPTLRPLDGRDAAIRDFVLADPAGAGLNAAIADYLSATLDGYLADGRSRLTIAIGCTGGRHRSVVIA
jgi:hypothetical protein